MRRHIAIRTALACGLTAVSLAVPPPVAHAAPPAPEPASPGVPAVTLLVGRAPTTVTVEHATRTPVVVLAVTVLLRAAPCDDILAVESQRSRKASTHRPGSPEPCPPAQPSRTADVAPFAVTKQPGSSGADLLAAPAESSPAALVLRQLHELLPRSDLPPGRTPHLDPRPA